MCSGREFFERPLYACGIKKPPRVAKAAHVVERLLHIMIEIALLALDQQTRMVRLENLLRSEEHGKFVTFRVTLDKSHWSIAVA